VPVDRANLAWPQGGCFSAIDSTDEHGHTYIECPDKHLLDISHHADPKINPTQAIWIAQHLNLALGLTKDGSMRGKNGCTCAECVGGMDVESNASDHRADAQGESK
jgi:hypothetical protein